MFILGTLHSQNHPYGSINSGFGHALAALAVGKDHGQLLIESAFYSLWSFRYDCLRLPQGVIRIDELASAELHHNLMTFETQCYIMDVLMGNSHFCHY